MGPLLPLVRSLLLSGGDTLLGRVKQTLALDPFTPFLALPECVAVRVILVALIELWKVLRVSWLDNFNVGYEPGHGAGRLLLIRYLMSPLLIQLLQEPRRIAILGIQLKRMIRAMIL
jgi:hypothetical protein